MSNYILYAIAYILVCALVLVILAATDDGEE